jgi:hypothetical protein
MPGSASGPGAEEDAVDIHAIVSKLTLEEQASLCSGRDFWSTKPVVREGAHRAHPRWS